MPDTLVSSPAPPASPAPDATETLARQIVAELFGEPSRRNFAVRYWTGAEEPAGAGAPAVTLVLRTPALLRHAFLPPSEIALAEGFARGEVDVEGDLECAAVLPDILAERLRSPGRLARLTLLLLRLPTGNARVARRRRWSRFGRHTRARDADAIRHHYDLGNDFYRLWLDRRMVYSCALFAREDEDLDAAQEAKLDQICRALRLAPGERFLDIGCGWGGLLIHAARHYGVDALGITLSPSQAVLARERIAAERLEQRCRVEVRDYRDLAGAAVFDKVASVGMFEHVGRRNMGRYFQVAAAITRPGGLFLNRGIVCLDDARPHPALERLGRGLVRWGWFIDRYIFPDGELVSLGDALAHAEAAGFETREVVGLREQYATTLRHWRRRLEARAEAAIAEVGEPTYRIWRLYLAGCAHAFSAGRIGNSQMLLARLDGRGECAVTPFAGRQGPASG
jgi:cyclopropane-fatty-acyl-phospholipid synthase